MSEQLKLKKLNQKQVLIVLDDQLVAQIDFERNKLSVTRKKFIEFAIREFLKQIKDVKP